jgi:hypothetical protein
LTYFLIEREDPLKLGEVNVSNFTHLQHWQYFLKACRSFSPLPDIKKNPFTRKQESTKISQPPTFWFVFFLN